MNGFYQISNLANVKSLKLWTGSKYIDKERILKKIKYKNGYEYVVLKNKRHLVHRLIAEAFLPNPNNFPVVNHVNGKKTDNQAGNLEWCDYSYNEKAAYLIGLKKGCCKKIIQYNKNHQKIKEWESITQASLDCKISLSNISECCLNKRKTAGGYIWKFKEEI